jgi:hypothetical protein
MWDLWWTKWQWGRFFPEYFSFPLSISFYRCSITWKNGKIFYITGLHNKPQGCGASVASATGPFTIKKKLHDIYICYTKLLHVSIIHLDHLQGA